MIKDKGKYPEKGRKGMVLILTFIIITTLTAIVAAFLYLTSTQLKGSGYDAASHKALWIAEAGIQKAIYYLRYGGLGGNWATTGITPVTVPITGDLGGGSYSVKIEVGTGSDKRKITSTGTWRGISRKIEQTVAVRQPYQTGYGVGLKTWEE